MASAGVAGEGEASFVIGAGHPSLPGHFPGEPVVPGVVVLDQVFALLALTAAVPRTLAWVKFARPLLPEQRADVRWTTTDESLRFSVSHAGQEIARGLLTGVRR